MENKIKNNKVNNDRFKMNKNQSTSKSITQAMSHMWRNSNTSLLSDVRAAYDVVQKNDENSTTKPSSSENKTPSK